MAFIDFNPRTREGCDLQAIRSLFQTSRFQSSHPRRVRQGFVSIKDFIIGFQSSHPRRVRQKELCRRLRNCNFNPRTREGCDSKNIQLYSYFINNFYLFSCFFFLKYLRRSLTKRILIFFPVRISLHFPVRFLFAL